MCKKAPGARCSGHTYTQLQTKTAAKEKVEAKLADAIKAANSAAKAGKEATFRKFNQQVNAYEARVAVLEQELTHLQRDYDGTPKGQQELQAILDNPSTTPKEYNDAVSRMNKGTALRSLRNNLLDINENGRGSIVRTAIFGLDGGSFSEERTA